MGGPFICEASEEAREFMFITPNFKYFQIQALIRSFRVTSMCSLLMCE